MENSITQSELINISNEKFVDNLGRVVLSSDKIFDLLLNNHNIDNILCEKTFDTERYNHFSKKSRLVIYDDDIKNLSLDDYDNLNSSLWFTPDDYKQINIETWLYDNCINQTQLKRVQDEIVLFKERNLIPLLKHLLFLVDHFRKNNIVWGVGRGSSVSSYILYLIGIHKVDSIKYNLDIKEFLK